MTEKLSELYYRPEEIVVGVTNSCPPQAYESYWRILEHQLLGLEAMGCQTIRDDTIIRVFNTAKSESFYNRALGLSMGELELEKVYESLPVGTSIELTPFTCPLTAEDILQKHGAQHKLSSVVLGKSLPQRLDLPNLEYEIVPVRSSELEEGAFNLFDSFFRKPGESKDMAVSRYRENLQRGPHLVALDDGKPIGTIGAIIAGDVASVYNGIVLPDYRKSGYLTQRLCLEIEQHLSEVGVTFYYYKTRNRAVATLGPRYLKLTHLYNERIYEKC